MRSRKALLAILVGAVVIVCAVVVILVAATAASRRAALTDDQVGVIKPNLDYTDESKDESIGDKLVIDDITYVRDKDLTNVLLLGIDYEHKQEDDRRLGLRSDSLAVMILDDSTKTSKMLTISRNTMTKVDYYDSNGDFVQQLPAYQITMQYYFGDSMRRSNYLTKNAVSRLLYDTQIDSVFALRLEALKQIVDRMGGITLTMPEDFSYIDSRYTLGATITFSGDDVNHFVRYRDLEVSGSAEDRLDRQTWFISQVLQKLRGSMGVSEAQDLIDSCGDYIESDVDAQTLKKLLTYPLTETFKVPGENRLGEEYDEFIVDKPALRTQVVDLFYKPAD